MLRDASEITEFKMSNDGVCIIHNTFIEFISDNPALRVDGINEILSVGISNFIKPE